MLFNIRDFHKKSITKFYYEKGRHAATSLRNYRGKLFVHKLLGARYYGVSEQEYKDLITLMNDLGDFFKNHTSLIFPHVFYLGYDKINNCIERVEEYSGTTLGYTYPTVSNATREKIVNLLLSQIKSLVIANGMKNDLDYSIDPTPENFTYDGENIYFIDFMPPLVKGKSINPQFICDKSRTSGDISIQMHRYFTQKGLYLTFITKFGIADISNFHELFKRTLKSINNKDIVDYLYNIDLKRIEKLIMKTDYYYQLAQQIHLVLDNYEKSDRDILRLMGLYFIYDFAKIECNSKKYRMKEITHFLRDKRCVAEIVKGLIYSDLRDSSRNDELKKTVADLIALQYAK